MTVAADIPCLEQGAAPARSLGERLSHARTAPAPLPAKFTAWLAELDRAPAGAELRAVLEGRPAVLAILESIALASPYLWELAQREPARLVRILRSDPDQQIDRLIADAEAAVQGCADDASVMPVLRRMKSEAALLIAIADIGEVWPLEMITDALTRIADAAIGLALRFLLREARDHGQIRADDDTLTCGYVALAMGKMGAFELNYSSDIDLICLFDPHSDGLAPSVERTPFFVRLTRRLLRLLQERTADGYVFRVDLRLRPDPGSTQIALSTGTALGYYETLGQTWERAALIKARPCAGALATGQAFLRDVAPFVWRKYLDYAALADVHAMKGQMHAYRGHDQIAVEGHNVKLGRGGIREIEFFVQTQQLIAGGRHPELRHPQTLSMLHRLQQDGWITAEAAHELEAAYRFLRKVEHRIQMINDEQTHTLPAEPAGVEVLARFLRYPDRDAFAHDLLAHLRNVQRHYGELFDGNASGTADPELRFSVNADDRETLDRLLAMGFKRPLEASATVRHWLGPRFRGQHGAVAQARLGELAPALLSHLARSHDPDGALLAVDRFLSGLHAGARLLSLLNQNRELLALLALLIGTAPRLADVLGQHPQVMDSLIDPAFFDVLPTAENLREGLDRALRDARSHEELLDRVRQFRQEQLFLIGARILTGTISAQQAGEAFAGLAEGLVQCVQADAAERFAAVHGRMPEQETAILAMGKLGGREMTAASDLDLIVIYDFAGDGRSDGARPLYGSQYFARQTQRLIAGLTVQTNYGTLYPVDMRLRPSGRSGPVATQIAAFARYQQDEAWTWEHMALTRARVVSGSPAFRARIMDVIDAVLRQPRDPEAVNGDVAEMRCAIATEKGEGDRWDLKYAAGGLVDLEFIAQALQLIHAHAHPGILHTATAAVLEEARNLGMISQDDASVLLPAVRLYQDLTQILRLCLLGSFDTEAAGPELLGLLARAADLPDFATLDAYLADTQRRVRGVFTRLIGPVC